MSQNNETVEVFSGILLIAGIHLILMIVAFFLFGPAMRVFPSIARSYGIPYFIAVFGGLSFYQLLYVIPLNIYFRRRRKESIAKGVTIAAVMTALLCGGCFLAVF
ncbi:MAG: hypothetical protein AAFV90_29135 [Cyanobacteria bacterium J06634_5]